MRGGEEEREDEEGEEGAEEGREAGRMKRKRGGDSRGGR